MAPRVVRNRAETFTIDERIFQRFKSGHRYVVVEVNAAEVPTRIVSSSAEEEVALSTRDSLEGAHPEADLRVVRPHAWKTDKYVFIPRRTNV